MTIGDGPAGVAPLDPVMRFRLRAILWATTLLAIAMAMAAPYWRRQSEPVQWALAAYWFGFLAFAALGGWINWRTAWRHLPEAGPIAHIAWISGRTRLNPFQHPVGIAVLAISMLAVLAAQSHVIAQRGHLASASLFTLTQGFAHGFMCGGFLLFFLRRPAYLCEKGILGGIYAPWKYIRHAEWMADRDGVLKLRRLDGDIYLDVPNEVHNAVEAFVRGKTTFVDGAAMTAGAASPPV
jgi:hypothetical protein